MSKKIFVQSAFDQFVAKSFALLLILHMSTITIKNIYPDEESSLGAITIILGGVFLLYILWNIRFIPIRITLQIFFWEFLFILMYLISTLRYNEATQAILTRAGWTCLYCIPMGVFTYHIHDYRLFLLSKAIRLSMWVLLLEGAIVFLNGTIFFMEGGVMKEYNMSIGYMLLYPACYFYYHIKNNKGYILPLLLLLFIMFVYASRGPILFFFVFIMLLALSSLTPRKILLYLVLSIPILLLFLNMNTILEQVMSILDSVGLHSRTLQKMSKGYETYSYLSGREIIWRDTRMHILEKPFFGWGIAGELSYMVSYPHSIFLEILLHYGLYFGTTILIFLGSLFIGALISKQLPNSIFILFFCVGFLPLCLSSTYLVDYQFWMLVGLSWKSLFYGKE